MPFPDDETERPLPLPLRMLRRLLVQAGLVIVFGLILAWPLILFAGWRE